MTQSVTLIFLLAFAYVLGSLSSAIMVCKLFGLSDPRTQGSGNPGTTNVLRIGGKKLAILVLMGDLLKGLIPVVIAKFFISSGIGWVGFAAIFGHVFPLFFQFKGGKGVATGAGVLLALSWSLGLCLIAVWISIAAIFRYSSLAAIITTLTVPVFGYYFVKPELLPISLISLLILYKHYDNMVRLVAGKESKLGRK